MLALIKDKKERCTGCAVKNCIDRDMRGRCADFKKKERKKGKWSLRK